MFKLEIRTGGAAFRDERQIDETGEAILDPNAVEVRRILVNIHDELMEGYTSGDVMDVNGNKVGHWSYE